MSRMHMLAYGIPAGLLVGCLACGGGGGGGGSHSLGLAYTNPPNASQHYALVKDSASTATTLVLDLVGPTDANYQYSGLGVALSLQTDASKVTWGSVTNGTLFTQNGGTPLVWSNIVAGSNNQVIQGVAANKGLANAVPNLGTGILAKVTLTLNANATAGAVTLQDAGLSAFMDSNGSQWAMQIQAGTLQVQ